MITASALRVITPDTSDVTLINRLWSRCERETGRTREELQGPRRFSRLARARFKSYVIFHHAEFKLQEIGHLFGGRDHSTISTGIKRGLEQ